MWPRRSLTPRVTFKSWESAVRVPAQTRNSESLPTWGSDRVLNTSAVTGAFGSGPRRAACFVRRSVPSTSPRSSGEGKDSTIRSSSPWARHDAGTEGAGQLRLAEGALLEILVEQLVVSLGHRLN